MKGCQELKVWKKAYDLCLEIYKITNTFPASEKYGLTSQIRRSAVSIPSNIAEGHERQHLKEYIRFLHVALGSIAELGTQIMISKDIGYLPEESFVKIESEIVEIGKMLNGLTNSLIKKLAPET